MKFTLNQLAVVLVRIGGLTYLVAGVGYLVYTPQLLRFAFSQDPANCLDFWMRLIHGLAELSLAYFWIVRCDAVANYVASGAEHIDLPPIVSAGVVCVKLTALGYLLSSLLDLTPMPGHFAAAMLGPP